MSGQKGGSGCGWRGLVTRERSRRDGSGPGVSSPLGSRPRLDATGDDPIPRDPISWGTGSVVGPEGPEDPATCPSWGLTVPYPKVRGFVEPGRLGYGRPGDKGTTFLPLRVLKSRT